MYLSKLEKQCLLKILQAEQTSYLTIKISNQIKKIPYKNKELKLINKLIKKNEDMTNQEKFYFCLVMVFISGVFAAGLLLGLLL